MSTNNSVGSKVKFQMISVARLSPGTYQPRRHFDPLELEKLANTIKMVGVLMPLLVRPVKGNFEIVAGERRWRAAQIAGVMEVPCMISDEPNDQALIKGLIENLARQDLDPVEEAKGIDKLIREFNFTHQEVGNILGKSRTEVTNLLRLLDLDQNVHTLLISGDLNETHGRLLAGVAPEAQYPLARKAVIKKWSTRDLEKEIKKLAKPSEHISQKTSTADSKLLERQLCEYFGAAVKLEEQGSKKGELRIPYNSLDELDGILIKIGFLKSQDDFDEKESW